MLFLLLLSQELPLPAMFPQEADLNRYCSCRKTQKATQAKASLSALLALGYPTSTAELNQLGEQPFPLQVMEQSAAVGRKNQGHLFPVMHPGYTCPTPLHEHPLYFSALQNAEHGHL